jgi:hypothetical protein
VSSQDVRQVSEKQELDIMEVSDPSEMEEKLTHGFSVRSTRNVGAPVTLGNFAPTSWKKKKKNLG